MVASSSIAGTRIIQNDRYLGTGAVQSVGLGEYEGGAVLFTPDPSDYPLEIVAIEILSVPAFSSQAGGQGAYFLDIWDEQYGTLTPPKLFDGGTYRSRTNQQGVLLTTSTTMFNRYTLTQPVVVTSGKVFVSVTQQQSSAMDDTTLALDQGPVRRGNWFFDGAGTFVPVDLPDGGTLNGIRGNWIIRLVVSAPDTAPTVTSITPATASVEATTPVTIAGTNFELGAKAFIGTTELALRSFSTTSIAATAPPGLPIGALDVKVRNSSGLEGVLRGGFTVTMPGGAAGGSAAGGNAGGGTSAAGGSSAGGSAGGGTAIVALQVDAITPAEAFTDDETRASISGNGFSTGAQVFIGGVAIDESDVRSPAVLAVTIPPKALPVGVHDVTVLNLSGARATATKAFTVKSGSRTKASGCGCTSATWASPLVALALLLARKRRV